jgi:hypothetical protein
VGYEPPHATAGILRILVKSGRVKKHGQLLPRDVILDAGLRYLGAQMERTFDEMKEGLQNVRTSPYGPRLMSFVTQAWLYNFEDNPDIKSIGFFFPPREDLVYPRFFRYIRVPFGRIHFAGAERAERGFNWMEGAVLTGNQAAAEVLHELFPTFDEQQFWVQIAFPQLPASSASC